MNTRRELSSTLRQTPRRTTRGFSLLELMLVLAIIGVLMAVAAVNVLGAGTRAKARATMATMATIKTQLAAYQLENSNYPPDLRTLVTAKYLDDKKNADGWGRALYYAAPGLNNKPYDLISYGEDGQGGNPDDIDVWTMEK